jgi:hypothetical protein
MSFFFGFGFFFFVFHEKQSATHFFESNLHRFLFIFPAPAGTLWRCRFPSAPWTYPPGLRTLRAFRTPAWRTSGVATGAASAAAALARGGPGSLSPQTMTQSTPTTSNLE